MHGKIDLNDAAVSPAFVLASGVSAGLFSLNLFGYDFSQAVWSGAGSASVSIANAVAIVAILVAFYTNVQGQASYSASKNPLKIITKRNGVELWVTVATVGLVFAPPFMPFLEEFIQSSQTVALIAVAIQAGGFYSLSYLG